MYDLVCVGDRIGIRQAYLHRALGSVDIIASAGAVSEGRYLTDKLIKQCESAIINLRMASTTVEYLQFLVEPSSAMHISDPRSVATGNQEKDVGR